MNDKIPLATSDNLSRRTAFKTLALWVAGLVSRGLAEDKKEDSLPPLPEIKTKEEVLAYFQKTLRPAISEALHKLLDEKKWGYATSKESFEEDIIAASKNIPALIQLEELVTKWLITKRLIKHKDPIYSELWVDIRVKGVDDPLNGFYWYSQSFNPERWASL